VAHYLEGFWTAGFWSAFLIGIVGFMFRFARIPLDPALGIVLTVGVWIFILLMSRYHLINSDVHASSETSREVPIDKQDCGPLSLPPSSDQIAATVTNRLIMGLARTQLPREDLTIEQVQSAEFRTALDYAEDAIQLWYIPVQALVWTLPALGFVGSAWRMRTLLLDLVGTGMRERALDISSLASAGPLLGSALMIICTALALSALSYCAVSLVFQHDLRALATLKARIGSVVARARTQRALIKHLPLPGKIT